MSNSVELQLVFPRHSEGAVAGEDGPTNLPPPVGLLTIAAYIRNKKPDTAIEVFDGNRTSEEWLLDRLSAPIVGFSVWFSNYKSALLLARMLKASRPSTMIVFGGPHATVLGQMILNNHSFIDVVVTGDGEEAMHGLLSGSIEGKGIVSQPVRMEDIQPFDLDLLVTPYAWGEAGPSAQAFPISCIRGCIRPVRCEYCAIPTPTVRTLNVEQAWEQIRILKERYGIDFFFESGDTFLPDYARKLNMSNARQEVRFRVYGYPGLLTPEVASLYADLGVTHMFLGIESLLIWNGDFRRSYGRNYGIQDLLNEIELAASVGIEVMPSFIFGLPGETKETLAENMELVREVLRKPNVRELHLNPPVPLCGTQYFRLCVENPIITTNYLRRTGHALELYDEIDYLLLCREFIDATTTVGSADVFAAVNELIEEHLGHVSHWYA